MTAQLVTDALVMAIPNRVQAIHFDFRKAQDEAHIKEIKNYLGFELKGSNNQILVGDEIGQGRADPVRRQRVYDATELVAMDTARIFASGVSASEKAFVDLLA
jgi:hypothetical protein